MDILVLDLRGNAFTFSPLRMMFAVGLSYMTFIVFKVNESRDHVDFELSMGYHIGDTQQTAV